jgi:hypothetical protein
MEEAMDRERRRLLRPSMQLIEHDVRFALKETSPGVAAVVATVYCERRNVNCEVEHCGYCERFARIEVHEAGYTMLCRSADEEEPPDQVEFDTLL